MTDEMLRDLRQAAPVPPTPKDFAPGVTYVGQVPATITTPLVPPLNGADEWQDAVAKMGVPLPEGLTLALEQASFDPLAWSRREQGKDAITVACWRYKFRVVAKGPLDDADLAKLFADAKRAARGRAVETTTASTLVVTLGDFQVGKVDSRGGIVELLARNAVAKAAVLRQVRKVKPAEIVLVDGGDALEGFESSPNADRTNDLQQTEQMRVWRRLLWSWVHELSRLTDDLKVVGVPSNHCRVRRGKASVGSVNDDYGLEVISQVADIAAVNPEAYGHVTFHVPPAHDEHLAVTLVGGKILGAVHGHQRNSPAGMLDWLEGQAAGRSPIGHADVVVINHYHNFYAQTWGDDRWAFGAPTMDSGSSWFRNISGKESRPGVLTFVVDESGWRDLFIAWADA